MDIQTFFKKYFKSTNSQKDHNRFLKTRSAIKRSESEKQRYLEWTKKEKKHFIENFKDAFNQQINRNSGAGIQLFILDSESSKGFICQLNDERYNKTDYSHFFDYLRERVLELNYKPYLSDVKREPSGNHVIEIQRHYLKPRVKIDNPNAILNQQFGNITIEYKLIDDVPQEIKFLCQSYKDAKFTDAQDYKKLIEHLLFQK